VVAREGASERKEEAFSGKKSSARVKKRVHSECTFRALLSKNRGEEEEIPPERFITRRRERKRDEKKKRRKDANVF